jgi:putative DNA primase/helicase
MSETMNEANLRDATSFTADAKCSNCRPVSFVVFPDRTTVPIEAASSYAAQGMNVFPVPPNTKKSYKSDKFSGTKWGMTNDVEVVIDDFDHWPDAGVGIPTGKVNGIFVVEADTKKGHGVDGIANLRQFEERHGKLPQTRMAVSPSGSLHYYFRHPGYDIHVKNSSSELAPGVDVRGDGGMVLAPPTLRNDGQYRWLNSQEIAEPPKRLLDLVTQAHCGDQIHGDTEEQQADPALIAAALRVIPNDDLDWENWNRIGMAIWAATGGSGEGFAIFNTWSQKSTKYDAAATLTRWSEISTCPPDRIGAGTIFHIANQVDFVLDPHDPMRSARELVAINFMKDETRTLLRHRGAFWSWTGSYYLLADDEVIESNIWEFLEKAQRRVKVKEDGEERWQTVPFKPNRARVGDVAAALGAVCQLDAFIEPPSWLVPGSILPAKEFLACGNGLLHLPTGTLHSPSSSYFNLSASEVIFDPEAPEPVQWLAFLKELFGDDQQQIDLLQEQFGYIISPDTSQQKILLIIGPKRSGKGTIARILSRLLGRDSVAGPTMSSLAETFGLEPLITKPLAIVSDARVGARTDKSTIAERLLSISGEDTMTVARKFKSAWHGRLMTRFIILTNELPSFTDGSGALAGRFIVLVLTKSFFGKEDPALTDKLATELPGILNWSIKGYRRLRDRGHFVQPKSSEEAIEEIEMLAAPVKAFIRDLCETGPNHSVKIDQLWGAWKDWCNWEGRRDAGTKAWFGRNLRSALPGLKVTSPRNEEGKQVPTYVGIRLTPSSNATPSNATPSNVMPTDKIPL